LYQAEGRASEQQPGHRNHSCVLLHVAALGVMIWIRVRRSEADGPAPRESGKVTACAVCGEPAIGWSYDGLDPNEQRDPHTGRAWSADVTHYRPACTAH
jgi:hypothetical protein